MGDKKKTHSNVSLTQIPTAPRLPVAMDPSQLLNGQQQAAKSVEQATEAMRRSAGTAGWFGSVPSVNSMLD